MAVSEIVFVGDTEKIEEIRRDGAERLKHDLIYEIKGARGRTIKIYPYKVIIKTDVTLGSILTSNATDGEKTIYLKDCIGVQFKKSGATIGYIQFETSSGLMNNAKSNTFNENTFTFEGLNDEMQKVYEYIIGIMDTIKKVDITWEDSLPEL